MDKTVELLTLLTLAIFGLVLPILSIIISLYNDAFKKLSDQYEIEKTQTQGNIKAQMDKMKVDVTNIDAIKHSLRELETLNKTASRKLNLLKPRQQFLNLSISNALSFLSFASYFLIKELFPHFTVLGAPGCFFNVIFGLLTLAYLIVYLIKIFNIVVEVSSIQNQSRITYESGIKELLTQISGRLGESPYLTKVYVSLNDQMIIDDSISLEIKADSKEEIKVRFTNSDKRMGKNIEMGFIIPKEFLIEKKDYSIVNGADNNIVRYKIPEIQAGTYFDLSTLTLTPLKRDNFEMQTFIKAENIESIYRKCKLKVI